LARTFQGFFRDKSDPSQAPIDRRPGGFGFSNSRAAKIPGPGEKRDIIWPGKLSI
jgi:hypothetical protein